MTTTDATRLAAIHYHTGFRIDDFLARLGALLRADNIVVGGSIQVNASDAANACSAMTLVDLSSGTAIEISQQLGSLAQGCRLDTSRLAEFGALLERPATTDIDLLILNKFGKAEAEGIAKMNEALAGAGGEAIVKLEIAALMDKRIVMLPIGGGGLDVRSTDVNSLLQLLGVNSIAQGAAARSAP